MKFQLTFKTPDVIDQLNFASFDEEAEIKTFLESWIQYKECIRIEFDSVRRTARVMPNI